MCAEKNIQMSSEVLETRRHQDGELFCGNDLHVCTTPIFTEEIKVQEREQQADDEKMEKVLNEDGRVMGRFVCGNVVNLSRRIVSYEEISLLSKGLRLKWYFKDK